jgi:hypothetical protein
MTIRDFAPPALGSFRNIIAPSDHEGRTPWTQLQAHASAVELVSASMARCVSRGLLESATAGKLSQASRMVRRGRAHCKNRRTPQMRQSTVALWGVDEYRTTCSLSVPLRATPPRRVDARSQNLGVRRCQAAATGPPSASTSCEDESALTATMWKPRNPAVTSSAYGNRRDRGRRSRSSFTWACASNEGSRLGSSFPR